MRGVGIVVMSMLGAGCVLPAVDLEGKACPCAPGWVCDEASQTCRSSSSTSSSSGPADGSTSSAAGATTEIAPASSSSEGSTTGPGPIPGRFEVRSFSADWSTPESIHWTWDVIGDESDFFAWTLWLATDEAALGSGEAVLVFDGSTNPELDRYVLQNTEGVDPVVATLTRDLEPGTDYFAKLLVLDTSGGRSESPNIAVRSTTAQPTEQTPLFVDEPLPSGAYPLPACLSRTDVAPHGGTHHLELDVQCDELAEFTCSMGDPRVVECWENLRLQNMSVPLTGLGGGELADAFIEFHLSIEHGRSAEAHGWWSMAGIHLDDQGFSFAPLTVPATGRYERFQIPLTVLGVDVENLSMPLTRVFVGSQWQGGAVLRIDDVRVRW